MKQNLSDKELYEIGFNVLLSEGMTKEEIDRLQEYQVSGTGLEHIGGGSQAIMESGEFEGADYELFGEGVEDDGDDDEIISIVNSPVDLND